MLIVTDEHPLWVGGQGGLSGTAEAEKHGAVAVFSDIGGAVHGEHALLGQHIVHHGEYGLLDLTGVLGAADHYLAGLVVHQNGGLGAGTVDVRHALEARGGDDGIVLVEIPELLRRGTAQQLVDEQVLAGQLVDDAERLGVLGIRTGKAIENKHIPTLKIGQHLGADGVKFCLLEGAVHLAPGNIVMDGGGVHNELVVGAAAGVLAGLDHQRTGVGQGALAAAQRVLYQLRRRQIAVHRPRVYQSQLFQSVGFHCSFLLYGVK